MGELRNVPLAMGHARRRSRQERNRDAEFRSTAQTIFRVVHLEREAHDRGDRSERDVALMEVEHDAQNLLALPLTIFDNAGVGHRRRIRAGIRRSQGETGDFAPVGKPGQPVIPLLVGAEMHQQFAGTQRIRHHHRHARHHAAGGDGADDFRMRGIGKAEAAIFLRYDHAEEFLLAQEIPDLTRQVAVLPVDLPVVDHGAQFAHRPIDEGLLLRGQFRGRHGEKLVPVGIAGEELAVPPHCASLDRVPLGPGDWRCGARGPLEYRPGDGVAAESAQAHEKTPPVPPSQMECRAPR